MPAQWLELNDALLSTCMAFNDEHLAVRPAFVQLSTTTQSLDNIVDDQFTCDLFDAD